MNIKNFIFKILAVAILSFLLTPFLPWWSFAFFAVIVALVIQKGGYDFLSAFIGTALFVVAYSIKMGSRDNFEFSTKIATILSEKLSLTLSSSILIVVTAVLFGLVSGLAAQGIIFVFGKKT